MIQTTVDCTYLLAPPVLIIVMRVVLTMGLCNEVNTVYAAVI